MTRLAACQQEITSALESEKNTHVNLGIIWKPSQALVQSLVHLLGVTLEETTTAYQDISALPLSSHSIALNLPPVKSVSPVKTAFPVLSSMK